MNFWNCIFITLQLQMNSSHPRRCSRAGRVGSGGVAQYISCSLRSFALLLQHHTNNNLYFVLIGLWSCAAFSHERNAQSFTYVPHDAKNLTAKVS